MSQDDYTTDSVNSIDSCPLLENVPGVSYSPDLSRINPPLAPVICFGASEVSLSNLLNQKTGFEELIHYSPGNVVPLARVPDGTSVRVKYPRVPDVSSLVNGGSICYLRSDTEESSDGGHEHHVGREE